MKALSDHQRDALLREVFQRGIPIAAPTVDELAELFTAPCLLEIARRRGFRIWLSPDHRRIEYSDEIPVWFWNAIFINHEEMVEHMQVNFLGAWRKPSESQE